VSELYGSPALFVERRQWTSVRAVAKPVSAMAARDLFGYSCGVDYCWGYASLCLERAKAACALSALDG
jgi:hypothetical protein